MVERITICDVAPRDGLQSEQKPISTAEKQRLVDGLVDAGLSYIELTSFVNEKAVPQMADAENLASYAQRYPHVRFTSLIMNERGYDRAAAVDTKALAFALICTETFSQKNIRMSISETLASIQKLAKRAKAENRWTRIYLSAAWVCPYEGKLNPDVVLRLLEQVAKEDSDEIALADTYGHAAPNEIGALILRARDVVPIEKLAVHLHDTQALGLANCYAAIQAGVRIIDSAVGGLGGCPFAPGAAGNVATEDLVLMVEKMGFKTGVDSDKLWSVVDSLESIVGRKVGGRTSAFRESCHSGRRK